MLRFECWPGELGRPFHRGMGLCKGSHPWFDRKACKAEQEPGTQAIIRIVLLLFVLALLVRRPLLAPQWWSQPPRDQVTSSCGWPCLKSVLYFQGCPWTSGLDGRAHASVLPQQFSGINHAASKVHTITFISSDRITFISSDRSSFHDKSISRQAFQLAIAAGVIMFHGQLVRHLTSGQLPVTALMSSDNGKAQVLILYDFDWCGFLIHINFKTACHKHYTSDHPSWCWFTWILNLHGFQNWFPQPIHFWPSFLFFIHLASYQDMFPQTKSTGQVRDCKGLAVGLQYPGQQVQLQHPHCNHPQGSFKTFFIFANHFQSGPGSNQPSLPPGRHSEHGAPQQDIGG